MTGHVAQPDLDNAMEAFAGISEDLVQSYQALAERAQMVEDELGRTNRHLEAVLRSLPTGVVVRDAKGQIVRANGVALSLLERGPVPIDGESESLHEVVGPDGKRMVVSARRSVVRGDGGENAGTVEFFDDRTELVSMTERMHSMDKMAALGTMGGGIAHEIRNPLNAVKGFAELLERELEDDKLGRWASKIVEGATEADAIIESLLAFANPERLKQEGIDGERLIRDAAAAALGDATQYKVTLRADAPTFLADRIKLRQALRNLIANAAEVQPDGGAIDISLAVVGDEVVICVRDAGPGIAPELRARVLDPFFTTRPEGTGLGLALVATIAQMHAGRVDVGTAPPPLGGAEFTLHVPFQPAPAAQPTIEKAS